MDFDGVVLIPGMMSDERVFAPQIASLEQIYPVHVVPCLRDETVDGAAQRVLNTVSFARMALVGHSMGGMVAMDMVRQQPGRINRLALMNTNHLAESPDRAESRRQQVQRAWQGQLDDVVRDELIPAYLAADNRGDEIAATVRAMATALGAEVFNRQAKLVMDRPDASEILQTYGGLALVLCGLEDSVCPPDLHRTMARLLERSELVVVPEAAHFPMLENAEAVTSALEWWLRVQ